MKDEPSSANVKFLQSALGLLLLAFVLWQARDFVSSLAAKQVTVAAEISTISEPDDARVFRAFAQAKQGPQWNAQLLPQANTHRDIRNTLLTVVEKNETDALAEQERIIEVMRHAFEKEGKSEIQFNAHRKASPVPNETTLLLERGMNGVAMLALVGGVAALLLFWRSFRRVDLGGPPADPVVKVAIGFVVVLFIVFAFLGGVSLPFLPPPLNSMQAWGLILLIEAIPLLFIFILVRKMREVKKAAHWSVGRARITKSETTSARHRHAGDTSKVTNAADIAYEFTVGSKTYQGTRISIGETRGSAVANALRTYPVGASAPVYYDPDDPQQCVLERDPPVSPGCMYSGALTLLVIGFLVAGFFLTPDGFLGVLAPYFPKGAHPHFALFFGLASLIVLLSQWANLRLAKLAAAWPVAKGKVIRSEVESYISSSPGASSSARARLYEPVVQYAFSVEGREYHNTVIGFGPRTATSNRAGPDSIVERYPAGAEVTVHYDPANPSQAILELKMGYVWQGFVLALILAALAAWFGGVFGPW